MAYEFGTKEWTAALLETISGQYCRLLTFKRGGILLVPSARFLPIQQEPQ